MIGRNLGKYKIIRKIGSGGMAVVYLAEDTTLDNRMVAIKMIEKEKIIPEQLQRLLERFRREAMALGKLSDDPGIVTLLDYGEFEGAPFLVMSFMEGGTLANKTGSPIPYHKALSVISPVIDALEYAHSKGIIHRDIKPSNILVDRRGNLALADFGIAKALEGNELTLTGTGAGVGTARYMAPEQWKGEATSKSDIYSLGVVLFEMLTGRVPFTAETPSEIFLKQMTEEVPDPRAFIQDLPQGLSSILIKMLDKNPENRYSTVSELKKDLKAFLSPAVPQSTPSARRDVKQWSPLMVIIPLVILIGIYLSMNMESILSLFKQQSEEVLFTSTPSSSAVDLIFQTALPSSTPTRTSSPTSDLTFTPLSTIGFTITSIPLSPIPVTDVPATLIMPTAVPVTSVPPTAIPATSVPPTSAPQTVVADVCGDGICTGSEEAVIGTNRCGADCGCNGCFLTGPIVCESLWLCDDECGGSCWIQYGTNACGVTCFSATGSCC